MKFAESFIGWYLGVCTKVFFLYLLVGIGLTLSAEWNQTLQNWKGDNISIPIAMAGAAFIFVIVARHISNTAGAMVGQSVTMHAGHLLASAAVAYGGFRVASAAASGGIGLVAARALSGDNKGRASFVEGASAASGSSNQAADGPSAASSSANNNQGPGPVGARPTRSAFYNPENGSVWTAPPSQGGTLILKPSQEQARRDAGRQEKRTLVLNPDGVASLKPKT
jgi:type IV secretory pathway TrbL component